jgi:hypothetical protein
VHNVHYRVPVLRGYRHTSAVRAGLLLPSEGGGRMCLRQRHCRVPDPTASSQYTSGACITYNGCAGRCSGGANLCAQPCGGGVVVSDRFAKEAIVPVSW